MEEDFVRITIPQFLAWLEHCQVQTCVKAKYDELFSNYDCFSKSNQAYHPPKLSNTHPERHHRHHDEKKQRPEKPPKDFKKYLTSYLNKLNQTNYEKILSKARIMITQDNMNESIHIVLNNCGVQQLYMTQLVRMIQDLCRLTGCSRQIKEALRSYYQSFIESGAYRYTLREETQHDEYLMFCDMQKHKAKVINLTSTWMHIWKTYPDLLADQSKEYVQLFARELTQPLDDYHLDLYLNVLYECGKEHKQYVNECNIGWDDLLSSVTQSKIKFLIEKVQDCLQIS